LFARILLPEEHLTMPVLLAVKRAAVIAKFLVTRAGFLYAQRVRGFTIPDEPRFNPESTPLFLDLLRSCRAYLEYGAGGSTVLAARLGKPFVSADTDPHFIRAVRAKVGALLPTQHIVHSDIGLTREWGFPVFGKCPTRRELDAWRAYAEEPWRHVDPANSPDLVLVDGRFRVAAALTSLLHLRDRPDATVLVDDYTARPHYRTIEQFARLVETRDHMALFRPDPAANLAALRAELERHATDFW
jgi:hypothetical protein